MYIIDILSGKKIFKQRNETEKKNPLKRFLFDKAYFRDSHTMVHHVKLTEYGVAITGQSYDRTGTVKISE